MPGSGQVQSSPGQEPAAQQPQRPPAGNLPDYGHGSLCEVLPSIADGLRVPGGWDHLDLGESPRVLVLLIDGLGHQQLMQHRDIAPTLADADRGPITSVFPSTTPTALASLGVGLPPGEHGLIGAVFRYEGKPFSPLGWRNEPAASLMQPQPTWWEKVAATGIPVSMVSPRMHQYGGLTSAAFRGASFVGADTFGETIAGIIATVSAAPRGLVYGYWEGLDKAGHVHGVDSPHYRAELAAVEFFVGTIAAQLPNNTRLVVTADHGIVDCDEQRAVDGDALMSDVELLAGEPRVRQVYTRGGQAHTVAQRWREELGSDAEVFLRDEAIEAGAFGAVDPDFRHRIGDVLALARPGVRLTADTRDSLLSSLRGQHGGLAPAEMQVPLITIDR